MSENNDHQDKKKKLGLSRPGRLELKKTVDAGQVRQSFSHGRSKSVAVEVRRKRTFRQDSSGSMTEVKERTEAAPIEPSPATTVAAVPEEAADAAAEEARAAVQRTLTEEEKAARARALSGLMQVEEDAALAAEAAAQLARERAEEEQRRRKEEEERRREEEEERKRQEEEVARKAAEQAALREEKGAQPTESDAASRPKTKLKAAARSSDAVSEEEDTRGGRSKRPGKSEPRRLTGLRGEPRRRSTKLRVTNALDEDERMRSLASLRRSREREKRAQQQRDEPSKIVREVVVPETITVQELANRMAERGGDVIKALMKMGIMATITQSVDADTAELLVGEFGHRVKRVSEADVEIGIKGAPDTEELLRPRPPVVTVMGHVDHGKTTLLDALRSANVAAGEAGGITQHIGAYQVATEAGGQLTFIDTPGHEAFTAMRSRGANVTDIVILVVAADDGIMPQTVEALDHAKAAEVPIVIAVNKIDRPDADPTRVRNELLQHELVVEELGGDILAVDVSAQEKTNLDKLLEAVSLQAELLELKANPDRSAEGVVIESKLERGRGAVATVLVKRGTLKVGDILVAGGEWGKVRALLDGDGDRFDEAGPSVPAEILGLNAPPEAGDEFFVVENEARAREITEFRQRRARDERATASARGSLEQMFSRIESGESKEAPLVIKADVQGSLEAVRSSLERLQTDEVAVRVLHAGVGGINESDVTLAAASNALIIGFNVRANPQARSLIEQEKIDVRYYSVIYQLIDDVKAMLSDLLPPMTREHFLGNASIIEVFNISKVGKVAGCKVTDGMVKRGASVRLLRDSVVIHEGKLGTLKRFKDEVREVREGMECGMGFENYQDIRANDIIECFEVEEIARTL